MSDRDLLLKIKKQLYKWAEESRSGGWSTHQVDPMKSLAGKIDEHLSLTERSSAAYEAFARKILDEWAAQWPEQSLHLAPFECWVDLRARITEAIHVAYITGVKSYDKRLHRVGDPA